MILSDFNTCRGRTPHGRRKGPEGTRERERAAPAGKAEFSACARHLPEVPQKLLDLRPHRDENRCQDGGLTGGKNGPYGPSRTGIVRRHTGFRHGVPSHRLGGRARGL